MKRASALAALLGISAVACSSTDSPAGTTGTTQPTGDAGSSTGPASDAAGDPKVLVGTFQIRLVQPVAASGGTAATPGSTSVVGKIYDGATLSEIVWEGAQTEGACTLTTPRVPFCNTPCGGSAACVENDVCHDYPTAHSAGGIKVTGLKADTGEADFTMTPVANSYQPPAAVKLSYPAFTEGSAITLTAAGDYFGAFTITAKGVAPLTLTNTTITLETGKALSLAWTPQTDKTASQIHVKLDISHHGGTKGMIECDSDDSGSLEIPAALLTKLSNLGVAGYPTIIVTRKTTGSAVIAPGRVDLVVSSDVEKTITIPGLTSCAADSDCPTGQTCQNDLTCK